MPYGIRVDNTKEYIKLKTVVNNVTGCWEWSGALDRYGYGRIDKTRHAIKYRCPSIHRLAYLVYKGEFDRNLFVCHHCNNRKCCNPEHLYVGTAEDNATDAVKAGTSRRGTKNPTNKLKVSEVLAIRKLNLPVRVIAKMYNISKSQAHNIVARKHWGYL